MVCAGRSCFVPHPRAFFFLVPLALAGCGPQHNRPVDQELAAAAQKKDDWDAAPKVPEWFHATAGFSGNHKAECEEVQKWIKGEEKCKASLCAHGRDLAKDWLARCSKIAPDMY